MNLSRTRLSRRTVLGGLAFAGGAAMLGLRPARAIPPSEKSAQPHTKPIPSSGERIPVVGMGTWITFNVGDIEALREQRARIVSTLFARWASWCCWFACRTPGHAWPGLRLFAMVPGPTALFMLGLLLLTAGPTPHYLLVTPVLWGVMQGVQAWWLGLPQDMVLPFASLLGVGLVVWKHRQAPCRERG